MNEFRLMCSDEDDRWTQWAGRDLSTLPHESALTIFWRFCWRNVLDPQEIHDFFGARGKAIDWEEFKCVTGWRCPGVIELRIQRLLLGELLFDNRLRYCPICLECGYHSVWHQFRPMRTCPLHDVPLMSYCFTCGLPTAQVSEYLSDRALPFCCKSCDGYLAGAEPDLDLHLDLLDQSSAICDRLDRYERWVTVNHELLGLVQQLLRPRDWRPERQSAFHYLVYRLVDQMAPSHEFALSDGQPVGIFIWQILPYRTAVIRRSDFYTRRSALGAYRNAIHKLVTRYVVRRDDSTRLQEAGRRIAGKQSLNIRAFGAPLVALALTRHWIEGELWHVSDCTDARQALLSHPMPFPDCGTRRYLRIEVQAYVSALYATFLEAACGALHHNRRVSTRALLAAGAGVGFLQSRQVGWVTGLAIFPLTLPVPSSPLRMHSRLLFDPTSAPSDAELTRTAAHIPYSWYLSR